MLAFILSIVNKFKYFYPFLQIYGNQDTLQNTNHNGYCCCNKTGYLLLANTVIKNEIKMAKLKLFGGDPMALQW